MFRKYILIGIVIWAAQINGNPIVLLEHGTSYSARKELERCLVVLDEEHAYVSIYVEYSLEPRSDSIDSYYLYVMLPVFIGRGWSGGNSERVKGITPWVEVDGKVYEPEQEPTLMMAQSRENFEIPDHVDVLYYRFRIELGLEKEQVRFHASYHQPVIDAAFLYIPLFEDGNYGPEHQMEILVPDRRLSVQPERPDSDWEVYQSRLRTTLKHQQIIEVSIREKSL